MTFAKASGNLFGALFGDSARRSYNQLGIGVNAGLRQVQVALPLLLALNVNDDVTPTNTFLALSSAHLADLAQQMIFPLHYCPTRAGKMPGFTAGVIMNTDYTNLPATIDIWLTKACRDPTTGGNNADSVTLAYKWLDVRTRPGGGAFYDRSVDDYATAMAYCNGQGVLVGSTSQVRDLGWTPFTRANVQTQINNQNCAAR